MLGGKGARAARRALVGSLLVAALLPVARAQEAGPAEPEPRPSHALRRQDYQGLYPFYSRETYEDGSVKLTAAFGALRAFRQKNGDGYHHLLPLYYAASWDGGRDRLLGVLPFYLRRRGPRAEHDVVLPCFARWRRDAARHLVLWPLLHAASRPEETPFRWIPTLYRQGLYRQGTGEKEARVRLGVPVLLELFEGARDPASRAWTIGNFFNFSKETSSGLPLGKLRIKADGGHGAHLFPLFFAGRDGDSRYLHTPLLGGWRKGDQRAGMVVPPLLSWWERDKDSRNVEVLWPLVKHRRRGEDYSFRALPFFDRARDERSDTLGILGIAYREHRDHPAESVSRWIAAPLIHWKTSPSGLLAWALPAFYRRSEDTGQRKVRSTWIAPSYFSKLDERMSPDGDRWSKRSLHLWPLFGGERARREKSDLDLREYSTLFPFFRIETSRSGTDPRHNRTEVHAPWPFLHYKYGRQSVDFRIDPFLFAWQKDQDGKRLTGPLGLFLYRETPGRTRFHLLPLGFGEWKGDRGGLGVFPFFYRRSFGKEEIDYWTAGRFFFIANSLENESVLHRSLLWKAVEHTRERGGDFEFRLFHRLVVNRRVKGQREVVVSPFFRSFSDEVSGKRSFSILKFLYRSQVEGGTERRSILFIPIGARSTTMPATHAEPRAAVEPGGRGGQPGAGAGGLPPPPVVADPPGVRPPVTGHRGLERGRLRVPPHGSPGPRPDLTLAPAGLPGQHGHPSVGILARALLDWADA